MNLIFSFILNALAFSAQALDAFGPNPAIDVLSYEFKIDASQLTEVPLGIEEKIKFRSKQNGLKTVEFHVNEMHVRIGEIRSERSNLTYNSIQKSQKAGPGIRVHSDRLLNLGDEAVWIFRYEVIPLAKVNVKKGGLIRTKLKGSDVLLNTASWPYFARNWAVLNDHPSDSAKVQFQIKTPAGYQAYANGQLASELVVDAIRVSNWIERNEIPPYGMAFIIGKFKKMDEPRSRVPLSLIWNSGSVASFKRNLSKTADAIQFFEKVFGPYPFEKLYFAIVPQAFNMENPTLVAAVDAEAMVHEGVHHWWGNTVRIKNWNDLWISEGLTTYFTGYFDEVTDGNNTSCFQTKGTLRPKQSSLDPLSIFDDTPYCKGASAVHDLRIQMAESLGLSLGERRERKLFETIMGQVFRDLKFQSIDTMDFLKSVQSHWIDSAGIENAVEVSERIQTWKKNWITIGPFG